MLDVELELELGLGLRGGGVGVRGVLLAGGMDERDGLWVWGWGWTGGWSVGDEGGGL